MPDTGKSTAGIQFLRGTPKKWEQVAPGAGAGEPVRLTREQSRTMQERLTNIDRSDTIAERRYFGNNASALLPFGSPANTGSNLFSSEAK